MAYDRELLSAVVQRLVPLDPAAGGAPEGVVDHIQQVLAGPAYETAREPLAAALERLDALARERQGAPFPALDDGGRDAALRELESEGSAGSRLLFRLLVTLALEGWLRGPERGGEAARRAREHMGLDPRGASRPPDEPAEVEGGRRG